MSTHDKTSIPVFPSGSRVIYNNVDTSSSSHRLGTVYVEHERMCTVMWDDDDHSVFVPANMLQLYVPKTIFPNGSRVIYVNPASPSTTYGIGVVTNQTEDMVSVTWVWDDNAFRENGVYPANMLKLCVPETIFPNGSRVIYANPAQPSVTYGIGVIARQYEGKFMVLWEDDGYSEVLPASMLKLFIPELLSLTVL